MPFDLRDHEREQERGFERSQDAAARDETLREKAYDQLFTDKAALLHALDQLDSEQLFYLLTGQTKHDYLNDLNTEDLCKLAGVTYES